MQSGRYVATFQRNLLAPSTTLITEAVAFSETSICVCFFTRIQGEYLNRQHSLEIASSKSRI